jgi:hypothetical protein
MRLWLIREDTVDTISSSTVVVMPVSSQRCNASQRVSYERDERTRSNVKNYTGIVRKKLIRGHIASEFHSSGDSELL